jgi:predicted nucleic acid-binding protein
MRYMLDTTVFNSVLDGKLSMEGIAHLFLLTTGVQRGELRRTPDPVRRADLLAVFDQVDADVTPASSFAFDIEGAGFDEAHFNDGTGNYEEMLDRLRELDRKLRPINQERDILIAETAIKNGATLVSNDPRLRQVISEFGGRAIDHLEFESEARGT